MALSLQSANLVRQKAYSAALGASPLVWYQLKAFFLNHAMNAGNVDLEFVPYSGAEVAADGGNVDKVIANAATKIYVWYAKKRATATATWFKANDHASTASDSDPTFMHEFNAASQDVLLTYPNGYAQGTGWTIQEDTDDISGSTRTNLADSVDGFYILGAA
jgi:hypothetical protein